MLIGIVLFAGCLLLAYYAWQYSVNASFEERISYDQPVEIKRQDEDLTDPAYGLIGFDKVKFRITNFISSPRGKIITALLAAALGFVISMLIGVDSASSTGFSFASGLLTYLAIYFILIKIKKRRHRIIRRELPNALELLAAMMKGGIAFDAALKHVVKESDGKNLVYKELGLVSEAMSRGRRRQDAFKLMAQRCDQEEVSDLVTGLIQADQTGGSLADVMRHHANSMFREYEAEVQERAEKLPVKMMFPMILTIFPSLLIVLLAPNMLRIIKVLQAMIAGQN